MFQFCSNEDSDSDSDFDGYVEDFEEDYCSNNDTAPLLGTDKINLTLSIKTAFADLDALPAIVPSLPCSSVATINHRYGNGTGLETAVST